VRAHGQSVRQAEQAEVAAVLQQDDLATLDLQVVPRDQPRRPAGWPVELNTAVETALAAEQVCPGAGVSWADWERVLAVRRADASRAAEDLRHLGAELAPDQLLATVDEVLTRKPAPQHFWELRTARVVTAHGYRYLSGVAATFLQQLLVVVLLAVGAHRSLLLIADGARLRPRVVYRCAGPDPRQDHDSGLVSPRSEMSGAVQPDLPRQACQSSAAAAAVPTVVARGRCRRAPGARRRASAGQERGGT
jgi:hypothetical protein